jgi:hypothetical protein
MRTLATLATTTLLVLFLATAPAYPQDDTKPEAKAGQDERNKDKDKKDKTAKPDEAKPGQEQPAIRPDERKPEGRKSDERQNENRQPAASRPQEQRLQEMNRGHEQHQAQRGKRIPDDKFRASFGRQHTFHVQRTQVVNTSQPVIVYGGYSFELVEAWPLDWGFDDDVYIDYVDDGYYLFDPLHPGIRIAVFVVE